MAGQKIATGQVVRDPKGRRYTVAGFQGRLKKAPEMYSLKPVSARSRKLMVEKAEEVHNHYTVES